MDFTFLVNIRLNTGYFCYCVLSKWLKLCTSLVQFSVHVHVWNVSKIHKERPKNNNCNGCCQCNSVLRAKFSSSVNWSESFRNTVCDCMYSYLAFLHAFYRFYLLIRSWRRVFSWELLNMFMNWATSSSSTANIYIHCTYILSSWTRKTRELLMLKLNSSVYAIRHTDFPPRIRTQRNVYEQPKRTVESDIASQWASQPGKYDPFPQSLCSVSSFACITITPYSVSKAICYGYYFTDCVVDKLYRRSKFRFSTVWCIEVFGWGDFFFDKRNFFNCNILVYLISNSNQTFTVNNESGK